MAIKVGILCCMDMTAKILLIAQIESMQKEGMDVHVICSPGLNHKWFREHKITKHDIQINRCVSPFADLWTFYRLYRCFKREKFDIIHTHTLKDGLLGRLAAKLAGVPITLSTLHGFYLNDSMKPWVKKFYTLIDGTIIRLSTFVLSQNPDDIETVLKLGFCKKEKIRFLGNGVNLKKFDPNRFDNGFKLRKRNGVGVPEDAIVVVIIGRLVREKGYFELFEAMQQVMLRNEKVWFVIIGSEEPAKPDHISPDTFKEYGISDRTRYLGSRDDIPELLACCDIYTLPSWREGFPRSAIEADAMGLPIVATDISACRQVVEDGVTGFLVPLRNSAQLKDAIMKLVENSSLRRKMGQAGFDKARREFDEERICRIVIDTYRKLLKKESK